jgi:transposase-like protein
MLFISLGSNCSISYQLKKLNLKNKSYPFDWCKTSMNQLLNVLGNDFIDYNESLSLYKFSELHHNFITNDKYSLILKNNYNITFAHELRDINNLDMYKEKIKRRIERFKNINNNKVTFVRIELNIIKENYKDKIIKLCEILNKYSNNYILKIIINSCIDFDDLPQNVIIYKYDEFDNDWQMNKIYWNKILYN